MKINVKRSDLFLMQGALVVLAQVKANVKFAYAIAKNKKAIDEEVALMRESMKPRQEFLDYEQKRIKLCEKYCEKDAKGVPVIENNQYKGVDGNPKFVKEMDVLVKACESILGDRKTQMEEFNKLIQQEVEFDFHQINMSDVPDGITAEQLGPMMAIIKE